MVQRIDRFLARAAAIVVAAALTLGAVAAMAADKVTLRLDWVNSGYHAIWYYGIDKGIFEKAGIDLTVLQGNGSAVTAQTVGNGSVMFGTADTAAVMGFVSQGMPIKIVAGYLRESPLAIIFPASKGWTKFSQMQNIKVGWSAGGATSQLLPALFKSQGAHVELINMQPNAKMTALLTGRVDGIDSFDFLMVPILEGKGLKVSTLPYAMAGINVPGLSLVANDDIIKKHPALVRKMIVAMDEAIAAARKDPDAAITSLLKRSPTLDRSVQLATLTGSFKLLDPSWAKGKPAAWMSPAIMTKAQDILFKYGGIKKKVPIADYFTNHYIPAT